MVDFGLGINVKKIGVCLVYDRVIDRKMIHDIYHTSNKDAWISLCNDEVESSHVLGKLSSLRQMGLYPNQGPVDLAGPTLPLSHSTSISPH
jgi:hypothetical protein